MNLSIANRSHIPVKFVINLMLRLAIRTDMNLFIVDRSHMPAKIVVTRHYDWRLVVNPLLRLAI